MRLAEVLIDNYRSFSNFSIRFEDFTVAIGRNNAGKTSLAHALELVFHRGSDRSVPVYREDFREQDKPIVIEAVFDDLDEKDTQAFFSLRDGTPGPDKVGVLLEAIWEDGEILCDRFLTRPEREPEAKLAGRYTRRYSQFIHYSYISPYREVETSSRFARGSDYREIVNRYAGDYVQPFESLLAAIRSARRSIDAEIDQRGGISIPEQILFYEQLELILDYCHNSPLEDPTFEVPDEYDDALSALSDEWISRSKVFLNSLQSAVDDGDSPITYDVWQEYQDLSSKVRNLLQRCRVQFALISLRDSVIESQEFADMQSDLVSVLGLLLPERPSAVEPFPVQDDRLFNDALITLGGTDLLQCGSGFQSTFAIGLRILRILAEVDTGVPPRLLMLTVEEPEAHLHPHKQRHVVTALRQLQKQLLDTRNQKSQFLVTTHSSNILSGLSFEELILLRLENGCTSPTKLQRHAFLKDWLDQMHVQGSNHRIRIRKLIKRWLQDFFHQYGEVLFARFTLFVEGHSERGAFPVWSRLLPQPNDLDQLGISILVADGSQLTYAARVLKGLGIAFLLVCDRGDNHDLSLYDADDYVLTDENHFEDEILKAMPLHKVLGAVGSSMNEDERQGFFRYITSPAGIPGLASAQSWDDVIAFSRNGDLAPPDVAALKDALKEHQVGASNRRHLLKGADVGALLAGEAAAEGEVPAIYLAALKTAYARAKALVEHG